MKCKFEMIFDGFGTCSVSANVKLLPGENAVDSCNDIEVVNIAGIDITSELSAEQLDAAETAIFEDAHNSIYYDI